jgi:putative copper export protein
MRALTDFLTTDYGLMSLAVIAFMLGMGVFYARYILRHMREDTEAAQRAAIK